MAINSAWSSMHPASWGTNVTRSVVPGAVATGFGNEALGNRNSVYGGLNMSAVGRDKSLSRSFGEARVGDAMTAAGKKAAIGLGLGALKTGALMGMAAPGKMNVGSLISGAFSTMNPAAMSLGVMGSVLGAALGVSNKKSSIAGSLLGGIFGGPLGAAAGATVGNFLGESIQDITDTREAESMRDSLEDAYGEISGRMAAADLGQYATGALTNPQNFGIAQAPAALGFAESIRSNPEYAVAFAQNFGYGQAASAPGFGQSFGFDATGLSPADAAAAVSAAMAGERGLISGSFDPMSNPFGNIAVNVGQRMGTNSGGNGGWGSPSGFSSAADRGGSLGPSGEGLGQGGKAAGADSAPVGGGFGGSGGNSGGGTGGDGGGGGGHGGGDGCFLAGTKILMATGEYKNIEDVRVGDHVMSYDVYLDRPVRGLVDRLGGLDNQFGYYIVTTADGGQLELTHDHPVYTVFGFKACCPRGPEDTVHMGDDDWEPVERLLPGDCIVDINGNSSEVIDIEYVNDEVKTYNLDIVLPYHTFIANGKVVHNRT